MFKIKSIGKAFLLFFITGLQCISCNDRSDEALALEEINNIYQNYIDAVRLKKGDVAMQFVSKKTVGYHDSLIHHILYSEEEELRSVDLNHRLWILTMRHTKPVGFWDTMTTEKWFLQMPDYDSGSGYYEKDAAIGECRIENNNALCSQKTGNKNTGLPVEFTKENDGWKINIVTIKPGASDGLQEQIKKMKITEADYFFYILNTLQKIPLQKTTLYKPLKKRPENME